MPFLPSRPARTASLVLVLTASAWVSAPAEARRATERPAAKPQAAATAQATKPQASAKPQTAAKPQAAAKAKVSAKEAVAPKVAAHVAASGGPGVTWTAGEAPAANCTRSRRKLWQEGEGWIVRTVTACR
ncbi:hypothetical protein [Methylobacterium oxalidis]|uniref:Uncharacterized protein n=1 Tax=Methylobacterium oxalidis TaxID=944322 RepID=A0A512J784_9HYPH|nr:hypothetical protein [Methylobacterium oxalidis]GEP05752.1 hypothetical protein MOX02_37900 [Methylobacterium oxalidis]GJE32037.1 hypothetical protein LDDCCGHA_2219 [Methylobacterium oxalidis]GLS67951.1 hypothetical protein GCM10007888_63360 [Methylobacterium oxalidis]